MPTQCGLKVSLISQNQYLTLPEIEHPETTQFTKRSPYIGKNGAALDSPSPSAIDSKADKILGRQSSVSVYVPSIKGMRFWVRLEILEGLPVSTRWLYCKIWMNGRQIQSCGYPADKPASYKIESGLFDPSAEHHYKDEDGVEIKNCGLERRAFFFSECVVDSVMDEGGVIEIQLFRAKGRQQRVQDPPKFAQQERYGLVLTSAGLVDNPHDAKCYNWHLKDPKEKPFVVFKFYYRSWNTLRDLQIVSRDDIQHLIPPSPSLVSLAGLSREAQFHLAEERFKEMGVADEPQYGLALEHVDEEDENEEEDEDEEEEEEEDNNIKDGDELSDEAGIEKYDDDFVFSSDIEDNNEHTASIHGSDADKEDNGQGLGKEVSAGEGEEEYESSGQLPTQGGNIKISENLSHAFPKVPDFPTDYAEATSDQLKPDPRPQTPYYISDGDELGDESTLINEQELPKEISPPKKVTIPYLDRPLPPPPPSHPVRKSSLRKMFFNKMLPDKKGSAPEMSQAQSSSARSSTSEVFLVPSVHVHVRSPTTPKVNIARIVQHSGVARLVETPPKDKRGSMDSLASSRSPSPGTAHSKSSTHEHHAPPSRTVPPTPTIEAYDETFTAEEDYPIGTAISPPSPYSQPKTQYPQGHFTTLPPPIIFNRYTTDPQKKSPRDAFQEIEKEQQAQRNFLSVSDPGTSRDETSYPTSVIDSYTNPVARSIRERRAAARNISLPIPAPPANLRIIVPIGEEDEEKIEQYSEVQYKPRAYVYENPRTAPEHRQPRRVSGVSDLKSPQGMEEAEADNFGSAGWWKRGSNVSMRRDGLHWIELADEL